MVSIKIVSDTLMKISDQLRGPRATLRDPVVRGPLRVAIGPSLKAETKIKCQHLGGDFSSCYRLCRRDVHRQTGGGVPRNSCPRSRHRAPDTRSRAGGSRSDGRGGPGSRTACRWPGLKSGLWADWLSIEQNWEIIYLSIKRGRLQSIS